MHPGNIIAAAGRMQEAMEQLQIAWGGVRDHWTDGMAQRFEDDHIRPIFERINVALPAPNQMAQALQQAQIQCGEPGERSGL
jgi:hypothetical protein